MLAAALGLPVVLIGCGNKDMQKIEVPSDGVRLSYDLQPGASYKGHIRVGNTQAVEGLGNMNRNIEADVQLVALRPDPARGGTLIQARFSNVNLDWALPPNLPISADDFLSMTVEAVQGMNVNFVVSERGEIMFMPPPPQDVPDQMRLVITNLTDALESAFLPVPERNLGPGESWSEEEKSGRKGKLGRYREGTITTRFDGMFRDAQRKEDMAKLVIQHDRTDVITTKDGSRQNELEGKTVAYFSSNGYLALLESEQRDFDPQQGMTFRKVRASWQKTASGEAAAQDEVQAITDPCDPDYVGPEPCADQVQAITDPCDPDYVGPEPCPDREPLPEDDATPADDGDADEKPAETSTEDEAGTGNEKAAPADD